MPFTAVFCRHSTVVFRTVDRQLGGGLKSPRLWHGNCMMALSNRQARLQCAALLDTKDDAVISDFGQVPFLVGDNIRENLLFLVDLIRHY